MAGSISLAEKLAVAAAFCALVAMAVGTDEDPGIIASAPATVAQAGNPTAAPVVSGEPRKVDNYWSRSDNSDPASEIVIPDRSKPAEKLPPGFGGTPSPEIPM